MHVTLVHIHVTPENTGDFIAASRANHEASIQEPGNLRFDVLQSPQDPKSPVRMVSKKWYWNSAVQRAHETLL